MEGGSARGKDSVRSSHRAPRRLPTWNVVPLPDVQSRVVPLPAVRSPARLVTSRNERTRGGLANRYSHPASGVPNASKARVGWAPLPPEPGSKLGEKIRQKQQQRITSGAKISASAVEQWKHQVSLESHLSRAAVRGAKRIAPFDELSPKKVLMGRVEVAVPKPGRQLTIRAVVRSELFDTLVLIAVVLNTIMLAAEDPLTPSTSGLNAFLRDADLAFTALFIIEALMRIYDMNFYVGPNAYIRDGWCRLDFLVVLLSVFSTFQDRLGGGGLNLSGIRALRVLKALKAINSLKGLKLLIESVFSSGRLMLEVCCVGMFLFFVMSVVGVHLFVGNLHARCYYHGSGTVASDDFLCSTKPSWLGGRECPVGQMCLQTRQNPEIVSFDNLATGLLLVFQCVTLEGWTRIMYQIVDTSSWLAAPYFVFIVIAGNFIFLNLFLGVLKINLGKVNELAKAKNKEVKEKPASKSLKSKWWYIAIVEAGGDFLQTLHSIGKAVVESRAFGACFTFLILANTLVLAYEHHGMQSEVVDVFVTLNECFTYAFLAEAILKILGLGIWYFSDGFNRFDFLIVVLSMIELSMASGGNMAAFRAFRILRIFRVLRVVKLFKVLQSLNSILTVLIRSMSNFVYVALLLSLFMLVYAILGMQLFGGSRMMGMWMMVYRLKPLGININCWVHANRSIESNATLYDEKNRELHVFRVRCHGYRSTDPQPAWPDFDLSGDPGRSQFASSGNTPTGLATFDLNTPEPDPKAYGPYNINRVVKGEWPGFSRMHVLPNSAGCIHAAPSDIKRVAELLASLGVKARPNTGGQTPYPYSPQGLISIMQIKST